MTIVKSVPVSTKKPVKGEKAQAKQRKAAEGAQGQALAEILVTVLGEQASVEEKHKGRLQLIVVDMAKLTHDGHLQFRARLQAELETVKALKKAAGNTKAGQKAIDEDNILGSYGYASIPTRVSQFIAISKAQEKGIKLPEGVSFNRIVAEAVAVNRSEASANPAPTKRKGRPSKTFADKAAAFIEGLDKTDLSILIALAQKALEKAPEDAPL